MSAVGRPGGEGAVLCDIDASYKPTVELTEDIADTLKALTPLLRPRAEALANPLLKGVVEEMARRRVPLLLCGAGDSRAPQMQPRPRHLAGRFL